MNRFPIEGYEGTDKYQITFDNYLPEYLDELPPEHPIKLMETDPYYRGMVERHISEMSQLMAFHSTERLRYILSLKNYNESIKKEEDHA